MCVISTHRWVRVLLNTLVHNGQAVTEMWEWAGAQMHTCAHTLTQKDKGVHIAVHGYHKKHTHIHRQLSINTHVQIERPSHKVLKWPHIHSNLPSMQLSGKEKTYLWFQSYSTAHARDTQFAGNTIYIHVATHMCVCALFFNNHTFTAEKKATSEELEATSWALSDGHETDCMLTHILFCLLLSAK